MPELKASTAKRSAKPPTPFGEFRSWERSLSSWPSSAPCRLSQMKGRFSIQLNQSKRRRENEMNRAGVTPTAQSGNKKMCVRAAASLSFPGTKRTCTLVRYPLSPCPRWPILKNPDGFASAPFPLGSARPSPVFSAEPL